MTNVADIYNSLFIFESKKRSQAYPIHKKLSLDNNETDLIDWISSEIEFGENNNVLDAGCGTGYSLIKLAKEKGIKGAGISISSNEVEFAKKQATDLKIEKQVSFQQSSFDSPILNTYDKILAIESLKHSDYLVHTLRNLSEALAINGQLVIADDFVIKPHSKIDEQRKLWKAPSFMSLSEFARILNQQDNFQVLKYNFTNKVKTRNAVLLRLLITLTKLTKLFSVGHLATLIETYLGGLLLELLYVQGIVSYHVIIATKTNTSND